MTRLERGELGDPAIRYDHGRPGGNPQPKPDEQTSPQTSETSQELELASREVATLYMEGLVRQLEGERIDFKDPPIDDESNPFALEVTRFAPQWEAIADRYPAYKENISKLAEIVTLAQRVRQSGDPTTIHGVTTLDHCRSVYFSEVSQVEAQFFLADVLYGRTEPVIRDYGSLLLVTPVAHVVFKEVGMSKGLLDDHKQFVAFRTAVQAAVSGRLQLTPLMLGNHLPYGDRPSGSQPLAITQKN